LPHRGRFILSLAPRSELGFSKAGEVRGGVITFTVGKDAFTLESPTMIVSGNAPYIVYVLHDADWEPSARSLRWNLPPWPASRVASAFLCFGAERQVCDCKRNDQRH
jgi:hypothetical protein